MLTALIIKNRPHKPSTIAAGKILGSATPKGRVNCKCAIAAKMNAMAANTTNVLIMIFAVFIF
jgi:hypothetical protein